MKRYKGSCREFSRFVGMITLQIAHQLFVKMLQQDTSIQWRHHEVQLAITISMMTGGEERAKIRLTPQNILSHSARYLLVGLLGLWRKFKLMPTAVHCGTLPLSACSCPPLTV